MSDKSPEESSGFDESTSRAEDMKQPQPEETADTSTNDLSADETTRAAAPIRRKTAKAPVRKTEATRKRAEAEKAHEPEYKAKNPAEFARQSAEELKKVHWPTRPELSKSFVSVLVFVLFIIAFVSLWDAGFGWLLLKILGTK